MIELPSGVDINNLIDDIRIFSWQAADILLYYSKLLEDSDDKKNILRGLMWKNFVHIKIETNKDVGRDEFRFIKSKTGKDITNEMALDKDISMA